MKVMLTIVLNKTSCFDTLLHEFTQHNIYGATIFDSTGMAHALYQEDEISFTTAFRMFLNPEREKSKIIFLVTDEDRIPAISKVVNDVTGGLDKPDTGIMFAVPVSYVEGLKF